MRKIVLLSAFLLFGGYLYAEPIQNGPRTPDSLTIWKSSNVIPASTPVRISSSAFLHQVVVSSPAAVTVSSNAVLSLYSAISTNTIEVNTNVLGRIQASTHAVTDSDVMRWTFDVYSSSGLSVIMSSGGIGNSAGSVQVIYQNGPPANFRVWTSSFIQTDTSTHTLSKGPVILHKVSVNKLANTPNTLMDIHNCHVGASGTCATNANLIAQIDISTGARDYDFDIMLSSGLNVTFGTATADVTFFYKTNPGSQFEYWQPHFASGSVEANNLNTSRIVTNGPTVFGGILNGIQAPTSRIVVYDSMGTVASSSTYTNNSTNKIAHATGARLFDFDDANYSIHTTSGIAVQTEGKATWTIRYRRLK